MTNNDNKKLRPLYYMLLTAMAGLMFMDYLYMNDLVNIRYVEFSFEKKNLHHLFLNQYLTIAASDNYLFIRSGLRAILLIVLWMFWLTEVNMIQDHQKWEKQKPTYRLILLLSVIAFLIAYLQEAPKIINLILTPFGFVGSFMAIRHLTKKGDEVREDEHPLSRLPLIEQRTPLGISFPTEKGELYFPYPEEGFGILGANGTGKSFYCLLKIHFQWLSKGLPGYIYDFKGNPPTLGKDAYRILKMASQLDKLDLYPGVDKLPKFHIFNPSDPLGSVRINPIDPMYIQDKTDAEYIGNTIYRNLDKEAIKKSDFWAKNAFAVTSNTIWTLAKYKPEFCTFAHFIALVLRPANELCTVLMELNPMIRKDMLAIISAYENEAGSQLAGVEATVGLPVASMNIPEIFYLTSDSEINLDISNRQDPSVLIACSNPKKRLVYQPILGTITAIIRNNINQQNRLPALFSVDELKTIFIDDLDDLPNTGRSNGCCTVIAYQDRSQLSMLYDQHVAKVIFNAPGNKIVLRVSDTEVAETLSKMMGEYDKKKKGSSTNQQEGNITTNESLVKEKVLPLDKVAQQPKGHAYGMVSGVKSPAFGTQIKVQTLHDMLGIKQDVILPELPSYYTEDTTQQMLTAKMNDVFESIHKEVDDFVNEVLQNATA